MFYTNISHQVVTNRMLQTGRSFGCYKRVAPSDATNRSLLRSFVDVRISFSTNGSLLRSFVDARISSSTNRLLLRMLQTGRSYGASLMFAFRLLQTGRSYGAFWILLFSLPPTLSRMVILPPVLSAVCRVLL
jgi:hypothetical protein